MQDATDCNADRRQRCENNRGLFIIDEESVVMKKWQILEFDGKRYYAFVPEDDDPLPEEDIPEYVEEMEELEQIDDEYEKEDKQMEEMQEESMGIMDNVKEEYLLEEESSPYDSMDERFYNENENILNRDAEESEELDEKPIMLNGVSEVADDKTVGDLYQVKVQGNTVTLEKLVSPETDMKTAEYQQEWSEEGEVEYLDEELLDSFNNADTSSEKALSKSPPKSPPKGTGGNLRCKLCLEIFDSSLSFRKHVAWTHKKKVCIKEGNLYVCAVCDYRTLKKSTFAAHLERKHETWSRKRSGNTMFPCTVCGFVCRSKHSLQSHFIRKHTNKFDHQCEFCSKKFKVKGDLTNHIRFHHKEKPVSCNVCGKLCQNSGSLYVHQKWAHFKPKFECHICKRRMVTQENLDQHLVSQHEKRDKIVCAECGKTFTKKDSFKRHMVVHTGCKPHACIICTKRFARRSQLRQHLLIHTGKRAFVCDICGKAFTQKPGLICHRKTHPGSHPPLPVMPIAEIVKEFTDGITQEINAREKDDNIDEEA